MGLGATVRCRCWEEGKCGTPPHAEYVCLDEGYLSLSGPYEFDATRYGDLWKWQKDCCPHEDMCYATELISNWGGYRLFQAKLRELGTILFPVLHQVLPNANGGLVDPSDAAAVLRELDTFDSRGPTSEIAAVDAESGEALVYHQPEYGGPFLLSPEWEAGVDERGFYVRLNPPRLGNTETGEHGPVVFRSTDFEQEELRPGEIRVRDRRTGQAFTSRVGISREGVWPDGRETDDQGRVKLVYPPHIVVRRVGLCAADFAYITAPLRRIFAASVDIGNPVRRC